MHVGAWLGYAKHASGNVLFFKSFTLVAHGKTAVMKATFRDPHAGTILKYEHYSEARPKRFHGHPKINICQNGMESNVVSVQTI